MVTAGLVKRFVGRRIRETRLKGGFLSSATWRLDPWRRAPTPRTRGRLAEVGISLGERSQPSTIPPTPRYDRPCCEVTACSSLTGRSRLISGLVIWAGTMNIGHFPVTTSWHGKSALPIETLRSAAFIQTV